VIRMPLFFTSIPKAKARRVLVVILLSTILLGEWLWWESYNATVDRRKRFTDFPLPFYVVYLPHWLVVDLAIALITFSAIILACLAVVKE